MKGKAVAVKAATVGTALFPGADLVLHAVPVPTDFAAFVKLPTAIVCLAIVAFAKRPPSAKKALRLALVGAGFLGIYLFLAGLLMFTNPQKFESGDYAVIGLWPTPSAREEVAKGVPIEAIRLGYGPAEWTALYSANAQRASALLLAATYLAAFATLTLAFKRLPAE